MSKRFEVIGAVFVVMLGITHTYLSFLIKAPLLSQDVNTSPSYMPILVGIIFTVLALFELVRTMVTKARGDIAQKAPLSFRQFISVISLLGVFITYIILMEILGWILCSIVMVTAALTIAELAMKGRRRIGANFLFGIGLAIIAFIIFDYLLNVPLPKGPWSVENLLGM